MRISQHGHGGRPVQESTVQPELGAQLCGARPPHSNTSSPPSRPIARRSTMEAAGGTAHSPQIPTRLAALQTRSEHMAGPTELAAPVMQSRHSTPADDTLYWGGSTRPMSCSRNVSTSSLVPDRCPVADGVSPSWFLALRSAPSVTSTCTVSAAFEVCASPSPRTLDTLHRKLRAASAKFGGRKSLLRARERGNLEI